MSMWEKFKNWSNENNVQITWFLLGVTLMALFDNMAKHNWTEAAWNFFVLVLLYTTRNVRL